MFRTELLSYILTVMWVAKDGVSAYLEYPGQGPAHFCKPLENCNNPVGLEVPEPRGVSVPPDQPHQALVEEMTVKPTRQ